MCINTMYNLEHLKNEQYYVSVITEFIVICLITYYYLAIAQEQKNNVLVVAANK